MPRTVRTKITLAQVKTLEPGDTLRDIEIKGFGARRQSDSIVYFLHTRVKGRLRWLTIGKHGSPWTPDTARKEALKLRTEINSGDDPATARQQRLKEMTFGDVAIRFKDEHMIKLKPRTQQEYTRLVDQFLAPGFGKRRITDIGASDISTFHSRHADTPRQANQIVSLLSKMFSWSERNKWREPGSNPCRGIEKYRENPRERYLSEAELGKLGAILIAAEKQGSVNPYAIAAIKLLLFTGARLNEILTLKWDYVHFDRGLILLPDSKTGSKVLTLNEQTSDLLKQLPRLVGNSYVIVGDVAGGHFVGLQKVWSQLRKAAGIQDVRMHDLRHSFASVAATAGGSLPLIGKLLGHSQPQTTARYAHLADDPLRALNRDVGTRIATALSAGAVTVKD